MENKSLLSTLQLIISHLQNISRPYVKTIINNQGFQIGVPAVLYASKITEIFEICLILSILTLFDTLKHKKV